MGYYTDHRGIECFEPDDTDTMMYIRTCWGLNSLAEIIEKAQTKWPDANLNNIEIDAENIHTRCLGYDLHDSGDWDMFLILNYRPETK